MPPCKNNGICIQPGMCACAENFIGPYCEHEKKLCLSPPITPKNSKLSCGSTTCIIQCATGHRFPDGSSITNMICKSGEWVPSRPELNVIPDCQATCTPPCENGGQCLSYNMCQCPEDFRGKQCRYNVEECSPKKMNFNGAFNCSGDSEAFRCSLSCPIGVQFSSPAASEYVCEYEKGYYSPAIIPHCVFDENSEVVSLGGSSHSSYRMANRTMSRSHGVSEHIKKKRKNRKKHSENEDESSYEQVITKTRIVIKKGRKKGMHSHGLSGEEDSGEEYDSEYEEDENESSMTTRRIGIYSLYMSGNVTVRHRIPKPATCTTWNGNKVKTFDGLVFTRKLYCSHTLVQDNIDGTFSVTLISCPRGSKRPCAHAIEILLINKKYLIENLGGNVRLSNEKKEIPIPAQVMGMRVTKLGINYKIHMELVGITILWDTDRMVSLEATVGLWNRTAGLCGTFDQHAANDFMTRDRSIAKLPSTFVDAWQTVKSNDANIDCDSDSQNDESMELVCPNDVKMKAELVCKKLLRSEKFAVCYNSLQEDSMLETCISDYCYCSHDNREECACNGAAVFAKECAFHGNKLSPNWRDMETCPLSCKNGRIYKACGPTFEQSCGSAVEDVIGTNCIEGCFCPDGTIQHDGQCIRIEECPCKLRGKVFKPGSQIQKDCNTCKCDKSLWKCSEETCGGRCGAIGDPHYLTFDGKHFDFMGKCSYYLLKMDNFSIEAENVACPGSISESMNFGPTSIDMPSCTKSITIKVDHDNSIKTIKLKQGRQILIDGLEINKLPLKIFDGLMRIRHASSIMLLVAFRDGLKVWWDGMTRVYVDAPASYRGRTKGLCGTFNANQQDDFLTPEGDVESSISSFANKWRTKESCDYVDDSANVPHPCQTNLENKEKAIKLCAKLKGKIFEECHWSVDPEPYYEDCLYDVCACKGDLGSCMCPIFSAYATECGRQGSVVSWRHSVNECAIKCPLGQIYEECADKCYRSCADIESTQPCKTKCVEGCRCPNGEALNDKNECIPIGLCPCVYKGLTFNAGYKEVRPGNKYLELCTCSGATWNCAEAKKGDEDRYPPAADIRSRCLTSEHEEFTTCEPAEVITCKNMHSYQPTTTVECCPGCVCAKGYVYDVSIKKCVLPTECSCHHGSKSYFDGDKIKSDCNTCTCKAGSWECTDRQCPATCSVWGDSHFETYDGKQFDFQGACNYVLSKGAIDSGEGFTVTIHNVLCGSQGVTCSKSVTIALLGNRAESVTLNSDTPTPGSLVSKQSDSQIVTQTPMKVMTIHTAGVFVVIEIPGLGVQLKWDRGTRIYVQLTSRWKGRVQGLCGNFDGDAMNDMQTPASGLETDVNIFGNSWKLEDFCPKPTDQIDACTVHPERKIWAEKKCNVLKSSVFSSCHSEVPVESYMKRCVYDSCACDQGGDCECLCTAIAAYGHACTMRGVPIRWRTSTLCPMQCDPLCSEYKSCIPACPLETCENSLDQAKDQRLCMEDTCVEGCLPKPCSVDELYRNSSYRDCVPKSICRPVCIEIDGTEYYEGDVTKSDNCQTCHCTKGKEVCIGVPCTQKSILPGHTQLPKRLQDAEDICKSGWSDWINQDALGDKTKAKQNSLKNGDIEPLPDQFLLKNLKTSAFCAVELIKQIDCRTVDTHISPKATGEDVECSLEKGLLCVGDCHDYEIRVMCDCNDNIEVFTVPQFLPDVTPQPASSFEFSTQFVLVDKACDSSVPYVEIPNDCHKYLHCTQSPSGSWVYVEKTCGDSMMYNPKSMVCDDIENVVKIKPLCEMGTTVSPPVTEKITARISKCPPGKVWSDCAVPCGRACHFYNSFLQTSGLCTGSQNNCEEGCISENAADCPIGQYWRDDKVCVKSADCTCQSSDGNVVKPGSVYHESDCKVCQCIDNVYVCDEESCEAKKVTRISTQSLDLSKADKDIKRRPLESATIVTNTVTPPPECDNDRLIPLIEGDNPLPDSAFNASSYLGSSFKPHFSRLNAKATADSSGSWSPEINDQMQYLQIAFATPIPLFGVIMRGSPIFDQYVTSFKILHSSEGIAFHYLVDETTHPQIFRGPIDSRTPVKSLFKIPIEAKVIRIYPLTWHGAIAIRAELLGCSRERVNITTPHHEEKHEELLCDDPLGVSNGKMSLNQITLSSFKGDLPEDEARKQLSLTANYGWRPAIDSPNEFIQFDFLELRNVTGIETKGGEFGWVTAYNIQYTQDLSIWSTIQNIEGTPQLFLANFDSHSPKVNHFKYPIQARAVKVIPIKWHDCIELKIEPIGCFAPYPLSFVNVARITTESNTLQKCDICPGITYTSENDLDCPCTDKAFWNGNNCVQRNLCPCTEGHLIYGIGAQYEKDDCSKCMCVLGGTAQCKPQECKPCDDGLRRVPSASCMCLCEPCPDDQVLCPSSGACIPQKSWCDGIQDCPDDEINCSYVKRNMSSVTTIRKEQITIKKSCPEPECPPGFTVVLGKAKAKSSAMLKKGSTKTKKQSSVLQLNDSEEIDKFGSSLPLPDSLEDINLDDCVEYECVPKARRIINPSEKVECPDPVCPSGYEVVFEVLPVTQSCAKYKCELLPQQDAVCNITGRTFNTFDGTEYKYDICDHVLLRDLVANNWTLSVRKNCTFRNFVCKKEVVITDRPSEFVVILRTDLTLQLDDYNFTVEQLQKSIYSMMKTFVVSKVGNSILFVSHQHKFWVRLDDIGNIRIGISPKKKATVDGLCGYYNEIVADDKRLPNGSISLSTVEFGDSWYRDGKTKEVCEPHACAQKVQDIAWDLCNKVRDEQFAPCVKAVNVDNFVSRCLETACDCLKAKEVNGSSSTSANAANACKCSILQSFVTECMAANENVHLDIWRSKHECTVNCPAPLVHRDCYRRRCEPSCDTLSQSNECPHLPGTCFPGCYCPEGTVRKGEKCIPVNECRDCICDSFARSQYITYDRKNFTFNGNCTYLLSRDLLVPNTYTFQAYVSLDSCFTSAPSIPNSFISKHTCIKSLHILYQKHFIEFRRSNDTDRGIKILIDGIEAKTLPFRSTWSVLNEEKGKSINLLLKEAQVEIVAMYTDLSFSIKVPSIKYGSKLEGLCGDCNGNPDNDLKANPKYANEVKSEKPDDILHTWLSDEPALQLSTKCVSQTKNVSTCAPLPVDADPCQKLLDKAIFGQCHIVVDPSVYLSMCHTDLCQTGVSEKASCSHLAAYARECSRNGLCVDWKKGVCQDRTECPPDTDYKACGCRKTCDTIKELSSKCTEPTEGCFCRDGKVLNNGVCIPPRECTPCDDRGHFVGDKWYPDKCSECECNADGKVYCTKKQCTSEGLVCGLGFKQIRVVDDKEECCPSYKCVPEIKAEKCPDSPLPVCGPDQTNKIVIDQNNCSKIICECGPKDQCKIPEQRELRPGEKFVNDTSGCCPSYKIVCDKSQCPPKPKKCNKEFFEIVLKNNSVDTCCDEYECVPPKKLCIVEINGKKKLKNVGEIWSTNNPCLNKKCSYGPGGSLIEVDERQPCPQTMCTSGFSLEMQPGKCCGECVQTKCVVNGSVYDSGTVWHSKDNCTTYKCLAQGKQFVVTATQSTCPALSDCPPDQVYFSDCCQRCKLKIEDQKTCFPISLSESETIGLVEQIREPHGKCVNTKSIQGFTECHGACKSGTKYNRITGKQDKKCLCCSISLYDELQVPVKCADGTKMDIAIPVPKSCSCNACEQNEQLYTNAYQLLTASSPHY